MFLCIPSMDNCKDNKSSLRVCGRKSDKTSDLHTTLRTQCRRTVRWLDSGLSEVRYLRIFRFFQSIIQLLQRKHLINRHNILQKMRNVGKLFSQNQIYKGRIFFKLKRHGNDFAEKLSYVFCSIFVLLSGKLKF